MNRYVLDGLAADLAAGKSVYLLSDRRAYPVRVLRSLADRMLDAKATFVAGAERITHKSGGVVKVVTGSPDVFRGASPDVVVILSWGVTAAGTYCEIIRELEIIQSVRPLELITF